MIAIADSTPNKQFDLSVVRESYGSRSDSVDHPLKVPRPVGSPRRGRGAGEL